jgi:hypothetical protein
MLFDLPVETMKSSEDVLEHLLKRLEFIGQREDLIQIEGDVRKTIEGLWQVLRCHFRDVI